MTDTSVSLVLVKEKGEKQWHVYYTSHALRGTKLNFLISEKTVFTIITAAMKLKPYFQAHIITIRIDLPMRDISSDGTTRVV